MHTAKSDTKTPPHRPTGPYQLLVDGCCQITFFFNGKHIESSSTNFGQHPKVWFLVFFGGRRAGAFKMGGCVILLAQSHTWLRSNACIVLCDVDMYHAYLKQAQDEIMLSAHGLVYYMGEVDRHSATCYHTHAM